MTIVAAWVKATKRGAEELVFVSDSRLSGGGYLDCAPKLFLLPRSDAAIGFSGNTFIAYPLLFQISQAINAHYPLRDGVIDYLPFRAFLVKLINKLFLSYDTYLTDFEKPDTAFLLGGYSWFNKSFQIDKISFNVGLEKFEHKPIRAGALGKVAFIGDWSTTAQASLNKLLRDRFGSTVLNQKETPVHSFHMEPFEVVRDLIRTAAPEATIAGAPQLVSVSQHMNARHTAIYWPTKTTGNVFLGGRQIFDFEQIENWILDPDRLEKRHLFLGDHS